MAPFQWREPADHELRHIEPGRAAVAKSTRSRPSHSSLGKRLQLYLHRFDSYLSNQRPIHESPLSKVLVGGRPKTSSKTTQITPEEPVFPDEYEIICTSPRRSFALCANKDHADQILHTSDLGAWFTQRRLKPEETPVPQEELYKRYCDPGNYHPLKRKRATEEDPLARWEQRDWAIDRCIEVEEPQDNTSGGWRKKQFELQNSERSPGYEHGKYTGLEDTERTKLFDKLLWPFPTAKKTLRSPYSSEPITPRNWATSSTLHGSTTPPTLPARFGYHNRLTTTLSTPPAPFIDRHRHFLPPEEQAKRTKRLKRTHLGDDKRVAVANPYDLDLFKPRGRANRDPHTSVNAPKTSHPVRKIAHRRAIADDNFFIPFVDETEYLPSPQRTPTDTDSEYLPSPQLTSTDIPGSENWLPQQPTSTNGPDSANQSAKMPASTTPTPPPPTTKIPSTTKIVLPSKISKSKSTIPPPLRTQISTHLRTTPALSHLNRTLLLSLKRQNWAHHVRTIARELLVSGRCTTYPEVMAVVVGAATQSLRDSDPDKEAKEQKKKRKRVEEGDISDDEFDSDGERVEDGIVNGGMRKKKMVERLLGELREEGVHVDIGIPRAVVEEGVNIVKGALREVVVFEDV